jgi:hypothetical protein
MATATIDIDDATLIKAATEALTHPDDYGYYGDLDMFGSWGFTISQHRGSDVLGRSNYQCVLRDLRAFVESCGCDPDDYVDEVRSSHWAVGWTEQIAVRVLIDPDGEIERSNITGAFRWVADVASYLAEQYPIYDESDYSDLEYEEALDLVEQSLADIRNDAENAVDDEVDGARLVPEWITAADVLSRMFHNGADTPRENYCEYEATVTAVWDLADEGPDDHV